MSEDRCDGCQFSRVERGLCNVMARSDRKTLSRRSRSFSLKKGEILRDDRLNDGRSNERPVLAVCHGAAAVQTWLSDGRRSLSQLLLQADLVELRRTHHPFTHHPFLGEIFALRPTTVCALHGETLNEIRSTDRSVGRAYDAQVAEQTHILRDHCVNIGRKTPAERLASFLLELSDRGAQPEATPDKVHLPMTHSDIADYLALQPETVSRAFSRLVEEGLITRPVRNATRLLDRAELLRIASGGRPRRSVVSDGR